MIFMIFMIFGWWFRLIPTDSDGFRLIPACAHNPPWDAGAVPPHGTSAPVGSGVARRRFFTQGRQTVKPWFWTWTQPTQPDFLRPKRKKSVHFRVNIYVLVSKSWLYDIILSYTHVSMCVCLCFCAHWCVWRLEHTGVHVRKGNKSQANRQTKGSKENSGDRPPHDKHNKHNKHNEEQKKWFVWSSRQVFSAK